MSRPTVGYVVSRWGEPTQTFVRREAEAVRSRGADVRAYSLKPPTRGVGETPPVLHNGPVRVMLGILRAVTAHPARVARTVGTVLRGSRPHHWWAQLTACAIGISWVGNRQIESPAVHLHAHFGWVAATSAWTAARCSGGTFSVVLHAFEIHDRRYDDPLTATLLRAARAVFAVSEHDRSIIEVRWGVDAQVARMGVPRSWVATRPRTTSGDRVVACVASLVPKKGHHVLLHALARCPEWRAVLVGSGPSEGQLCNLARELGLGGRVEFRGYVCERDVRVILDASSAFALPSVVTESGDRDGVPVALMEAMGRGIPVVASRLGGIPELVEGAGLLVTPGDVAALAAALGELEDPARRAELASAGWRRVANEWTIERAVERLLPTLGVER